MMIWQCRAHNSICRTCRPAVSTFSAIRVARFGHHSCGLVSTLVQRSTNFKAQFRLAILIEAIQVEDALASRSIASLALCHECIPTSDTRRDCHMNPIARDPPEDDEH